MEEREIGVCRIGTICHVEDDGGVSGFCCGKASVTAEECGFRSVVVVDEGRGWRNDGEWDSICLSLDVGVVQVGAIVPGVRRLILVIVPSNDEGRFACGLNLAP